MIAFYEPIKMTIQHRILREIQNYSVWLFFLFLILLVFYINHLTPLWADDLCRSGVNGIEPIKRAYVEYFAWSGRFFVILQTYFFFGDGAYKLQLLNIANTLSFAALILGVFLVSNLRSPNRIGDVADLALTTAIIAAVGGAFFEVTFWKTAAIGYTWAMAGELFIIYLFLSQKVASITNRWLRAGLPVFCFYIATFLENASITTSLILIFLVLDKSFKNGKYSSIYHVCTVTHLVGTAFLLAAPGNFVRKTHFFQTTLFSENLLNFITLYSKLLMDNGWILLIVLIATIHLKTKSKNTEKNSIFSSSTRVSLFLAASFASVIVIAPVGILGTRTAFPAEVFLTVALLTMFSSRQRVWVIDLAITGASALVISAVFYTTIEALHQIDNQDRYRNDLVTEFKKNDAKFWTIPHYFVDGHGWNNSRLPKWIFLRDITPDPEDWVNQCFARGMGAKDKAFKIVGVSSPVYLLNKIPPFVSARAGDVHDYPEIFFSNGNINYRFEKSCKQLSKAAQNIFLHIIPVKEKDIHPKHWGNGFDNLDFEISSEDHRALVVKGNGVYIEDMCVAYARLPNYKFKKIVTGVYDPVTGIRSYEKSFDRLAH